MPVFSWKILFSRLITFGISAFFSAFSASYVSGHDLKQALTASVAALVAAVFLGVGYDREQYQNSVRAFQAQQIQAQIAHGPHDPVIKTK